MGSFGNSEEVQYLYHFQNSNHSQLLNDATLQNCLEPAKIEIRTQVDDDGIWVVMMSCQIILIKIMTWLFVDFFEVSLFHFHSFRMDSRCPCPETNYSFTVHYWETWLRVCLVKVIFPHLFFFFQMSDHCQWLVLSRFFFLGRLISGKKNL